MASLPLDDDKDLDDAALWAVIDSAAAAAASYSSSAVTTTTTATNSATSKSRKPLTLRNPNHSSPHVFLPSSPSPPSSHHKSLSRTPHHRRLDPPPPHRPHKIARFETCDTTTINTSPEDKSLMLVQRVPVTPMYNSHSPSVVVKDLSPYGENNRCSPLQEKEMDKEKLTHCLAGRFPTVSLFKDYQDAAMAVIDKSDYTVISGSPYIKKSGWRKIAFYFNVSFEIKDKSIEFDENRNVQRAEFVVRAYMQGGRFSDGWGSCERREKRFIKPNNDIPSTAETRAKNKACQDLLGIGAYRPSVNHNPSPR